MMTNLFSMFDPSSSSLNLNWLALLTPLILLSNSTSKTSKGINSISKMISVKFITELTPLSKSKTHMKALLIPSSSFILILILNTMAILPFTFTCTAHIIINLPTALALWLAVFTTAWIKTPSKSLIHLIPSGTPLMLAPFMVVIELLSSLIRPVTLSIRLTANLMAGHLLMSLSGNAACSSLMMTTLSIPISMALTILELAVAVIQAYIFNLLMSLYITEN